MSEDWLDDLVGVGAFKRLSNCDANAFVRILMVTLHAHCELAQEFDEFWCVYFTSRLKVKW